MDTDSDKNIYKMVRQKKFENEELWSKYIFSITRNVDNINDFIFKLNEKLLILIKEMKKSNIGYLYCITNEVYTHYGKSVYKCGKTQNIGKRLQNFTTCYMENCELKNKTQILNYINNAEMYLFELLDEYRCKKNREFFDCELSIITEKMKIVEEKFKGEIDENIEKLINSRCIEMTDFAIEKIINLTLIKKILVEKGLIKNIDENIEFRGMNKHLYKGNYFMRSQIVELNYENEAMVKIYENNFFKESTIQSVIKIVPEKQLLLILENKKIKFIDVLIESELNIREMIIKDSVKEASEWEKNQIFEDISKYKKNDKFKILGKEMIKKSDLINKNYENGRMIRAFKEYFFEENKFKKHFKICELFKKDVNVNVKKFDDAGNNLKFTEVEKIALKISIIEDIEKALGIKRLEIDTDKITPKMKESKITFSNRNGNDEINCEKWIEKIKKVFKITATERVKKLKELKYGTWYLQLIYLYKHIGSKKIMLSGRDDGQDMYCYTTNWELIKDSLYMYGLRNVNYKEIHPHVLKKCDMGV